MKIINTKTREILTIDEMSLLKRSKIALRLKKNMESIEKQWENISDNLDTSVYGYLVSTKKTKQAVADRAWQQYVDAEQKYINKVSLLIKKYFVGFELYCI